MPRSSPIAPTTTSPELRPMRTEKLSPCSRRSSRGVRAKLLLQMQGRVAGALGVILVRDRRAEQRHDAVAGVLVDGALEAVHALGEDREEAIHDLVPLLRVELLGELHRALHVGEEHGHLLALAFRRRWPARIFSARCSGTSGRRSATPGPRARCSSLAARVAEALIAGVGCTAARAPARDEQRRGTVPAETGIRRIGATAGGTVHGLGAGPGAASCASLLPPPVLRKPSRRRPSARRRSRRPRSAGRRCPSCR